ncbi:MAG: hypothetical protein RMJ56_00875 [Gemmataceae bacterium]|nr:hypothetical protein [Gemmata sp.]MDW8196134.1 hypothetical protein [Gemmataceae bacterium]
MQRIGLTLAAVIFGTSGLQADWGGRVPPPPGSSGATLQLPEIGGPNTLWGAGEPYNGVAPDRYGLNPRLKKFFRIGSLKEPASVPPPYYWPMMGYNQKGPAYNPQGYPPGAYGPMQGTLVFPHHPFVRSPRDFFMYEPK